MWRTLAACAAFALYAGRATAQLVVTEFDPQQPHESFGLFEPREIAGGKIIVRARGSDIGDSRGMWNAIYVLDSAGRVSNRIARVDDAMNYRQALADLENAAVTVNKQIKAMPPGKLAYILETPPAGWVDIVLTPDGFGTGYGNDPYGALPLAVADETLVHIVKQHREAAAKGWISIRD